MNTLFDSAGLAVVAFAEVSGADGSATINSGITTTKTATGTYDITLPADKAQADARDLIFVQPIGTAATPLSAKVAATSNTVKTVRISDAATLADGDFSILILRTITP